ncbi:MAG: 2-polyprenyl-6-methoxyphenol hydroxylase-like oxidoreductase [Chloroflexi bacterium]|nr:2-polyprenyl-6-methoxyphenol hydroxylase-like oxidoreductase [Chloroflexota bacterium]
MTAPRHHAIVIGSSVAGLLAARILSDHFERVTVLDRDTLPDDPEPRKGVPQATHVHILLRRGGLILEDLLPGFDADLAQAGAPLINWTSDFVYFTPAGWGPRFPSTFTTRGGSRGLLEYTLRHRVAARPNVTFEARCEAIGLLTSEDRSTVTGVRLNYRDRTSDARSNLPGDLIVDASGRTSRVLDWLTESGYTPPAETVIDSHLGYATRVYQRPPHFAADWRVMMVRARPPYGTRGGLIYPIEHDRWMVNLGGAGDERPPTDEQAFVEFMRTFIHPALYEAIKDAEPISPVYGYRRTENRWRHYEQLTRWPENFIVLGDAAYAFNPIYGQGMTVAGLEAQALDRWLRTSLGCWDFQKSLAKVVRLPWLLATNEDSRIPGVEGNARPNRLDALLQRYIDEVVWLASADAVTFETFVRVSHLTAPPTALMQPHIALGVLKRWLRRLKPAGQSADPIPAAPSSRM